MIAPLSFLAAFDKPQAKPVAGEAEAQETAENAGSDGFAALIAQLIQILPTPDEQGAETSLPAGGEIGNLPTGKILPVDGHDLAVSTAGQAASEELASASSLPVSAALMNSSATIISFQQALAGQATKQGEPIAQGATDVDLPQTPAKDGPVAASTPRADQIRMTVSVAPAETVALRTAAAQDGAAPVEKQLSQAAGSLSKVAPEGLASGAPAQSARAGSLEKEAGSGERQGQASAGETTAGSGRISASDAAKPGAMPFAAAIETAAANRADGGARMAAPAPANMMTSVEGIERLVDRLSLAREFDMTKSASIAVTHREFGALTVTFDNARSGLDVEIVAKDNDMQRALALAVATDRPASRAGEPLQQSFQQASQATSTASERGAGTTGQGANSSGASSSDGGAQGDRSQNQRGRGLPSGSQDPRNPARPSTGDDALYA